MSCLTCRSFGPGVLPRVWPHPSHLVTVPEKSGQMGPGEKRILGPWCSPDQTHPLPQRYHITCPIPWAPTFILLLSLTLGNFLLLHPITPHHWGCIPAPKSVQSSPATLQASALLQTRPAVSPENKAGPISPLPSGTHHRAWHTVSAQGIFVTE